MPGFLILLSPDPFVSRCLSLSSCFWSWGLLVLSPFPALPCTVVCGESQALEAFKARVHFEENKEGKAERSRMLSPLSHWSTSLSKALGSLENGSVWTGLGWHSKEKMLCWWRRTGGGMNQKEPKCAELCLHPWASQHWVRSIWCSEISTFIYQKILQRAGQASTVIASAVNLE